MFLDFKSVFPVLIFISGSIAAEFLAINWNLTVNDGNSHMEREYKYPMFQEVAPAPCDLSDICDVLCCQDPDCDEYQRSSFNCSESQDTCGKTLSFFDCSCDNFDQPEWFSLLCYVSKNPIYLGKFFITPEKIERISTFQSLLGRKLKNYLNRQNKAEIFIKAVNDYKFDSPIMTYVPTSDSSKFPSVTSLLTKTPLKDSSHVCKTSSVNYRVNDVTICHEKLTPKACQNGHMLSVTPYLIQDSSSYNYSDMPIVLRSLDFLEGVETEVTIKCALSRYYNKKFQKQKFYFSQHDILKECDDVFTKYNTVWTGDMCLNVLSYVGYQFMVNGSDIIQLKVQYGLTNLSLPGDDNVTSSVFDTHIYFKQVFNVTFFDLMETNSERCNLSKRNELFNRGYFIGEDLNFGYKSVKNSSTSWQRGLLSVFKNGGSCEDVVPVTFGFNRISRCGIRKAFSNCSEARSEAEGKLEALLRGDALAAYSNLRTPFDDSVPLLRSFSDSSRRDLDNSTECSVPVFQDVVILYTSVYAEGGEAAHRVLGARVDRAFRSVSTGVDFSLTSRVTFSCVSSKDKPMSRFWLRMTSEELSENAWLNMFDAFEDASPDEEEEIAFWCIFLALAASGIVAATKLDFNLGEFFINYLSLR